MCSKHIVDLAHSMQHVPRYPIEFEHSTFLQKGLGQKMRDGFRAISFDGMSEGYGRGSVDQWQQPILVLDGPSDMVMMTLQKGLVDHS